MAEEEAENGERAKEDDEYVGYQRDDAGSSIGAVIVNQTTAYNYSNQYQRSRFLTLPPPLFSLCCVVIVAIHHPRSLSFFLLLYFFFIFIFIFIFLPFLNFLLLLVSISGHFGLIQSRIYIYIYIYYMPQWVGSNNQTLTYPPMQ